MIEAAELVTTPPSSTKIVGDFLRGLWYPSTLNPYTHDFRNRSIRGLEETFNRRGLKNNEFVALPVGSVAVGLATHKSDIDTLAIVDADKYTFLRYLRFLPIRCGFGNKWSVDLLSCSSVSFAHLNTASLEIETLAALSLTPDEFIAGNLDYARALRVGVLEGENHEKTWESIEKAFDGHYKGWAERDFDGKKRRERYDANLSALARETYSPGGFISRAMEAHSALQLPAFEIYREALRETSGALRI